MNIHIKTRAVITCPHCGHRETESMPFNACQVVYQCKQCAMMIKPMEKECCVFCSYSDSKCPPVQMEESMVLSYGLSA